VVAPESTSRACERRTQRDSYYPVNERRLIPLISFKADEESENIKVLGNINCDCNAKLAQSLMFEMCRSPRSGVRAVTIISDR
jgi:hypothetical protein